MRYTGDDGKTLRQLLGESLRAMENELSLIRESLETMSKNADPKNAQDDWSKYQLAVLSESVQDLEFRMVALERHASLERWLIRQVLFLVCAGALLYAWGALA